MSDINIKPHTLVLGSSGFLGGYLRETINNAITHTAHGDSKDFDIALKLNNASDLDYLFKNVFFDSVINSIALTDIDKCEKEKDLAKWLNSDLPRLIASYCRNQSSRLIHISTDAVFDGEKSLREEFDLTKPKSYYGLTKLIGEKNVLEDFPEAQVLRVNFFGRSSKNNIFDFFYNAGRQNLTVRGFNNLFFTPLYVGELASIIKKMLFMNAFGVFHVVGSERISKYDFGKLIFEEFKFNVSNIIPTNLENSPDFKLELRNRDLSLSNNKIKSMGFKIPTLKHSIHQIAREMRDSDQK